MELHLNVENFGKIKSAKINISNYTIFVGENNSGKTYLMQLVYGVLKSIPSISLECIEKYMKPNSSVFVSDVDFWETLEKEINFHLDKGKTTLVRNIFHKEIPIHSLQIKIIPDQTETGWIISSLKTEKSVRDILNKQALKVENFQLEPFMEEDECQVSFFIGEKNFSKNITRNLILPRDNFFIDFRGTLSNFLICTIFNIDYTTNSNFLFLPASRTGLQQLYPYFFSEHRQAWGLSGYAKEQATKNVLGVSEPVYEFLDFLLKYVPLDEASRANASLLNFIEDHMIDGKVASKENITYYMPKQSTENIPLYLASSMINELTPLIKILTHNTKTSFLFYDEVESCLHPSKQAEMARLLNRLNNSGTRLMISTHSDNMATEINNLLLLSFLQEAEHSRNKKLKKLGLEPEDLLKKPNVHVYEFRNQKDGGSLVTEMDFKTVPNIGYDFSLFTQNTNRLYEKTKIILGIDE